MRVVSLDEGWSGYVKSWQAFHASEVVPPRPVEGIMVFEDDFFVGGCTIIPLSTYAMLAGGIVFAADLDVEGYRARRRDGAWPTTQGVLDFILYVLRGHSKVTDRLALVDTTAEIASTSALEWSSLYVLSSKKPPAIPDGEREEPPEEPPVEKAAGMAVGPIEEREWVKDEEPKKKPATKKKASKKKPRAKRKKAIKKK